MLLIFGIAVVAFHVSHTTFSFSDIDYFWYDFVHHPWAGGHLGKMEESEETSPSQLAFVGCMLTQDHAEALAMEEPTDTTSV